VTRATNPWGDARPFSWNIFQFSSRYGDTITATACPESLVGEERRRTPRYPFIATAEVTDQSSHANTSTRVTELSLHGCYLDMANPLPKDTRISIKIYSEGKFFESTGTIVYSQPNLGVGVTFREIRPQFLTVLKQWLLAAAVAKYGPKT
jgi:PilZ domain